MRPRKKVILFGLCALFSLPAYSITPTEDLGNCLVDALDGKERKQLAKWIFFAIASHPEISTYSKATADDIDASNQLVGKLITRLLTKDCTNQMKLANDSDPQALQKAFELVGKVAMQELLANEAVNNAIIGYTHYTDTDKINSILDNSAQTQ